MHPVGEFGNVGLRALRQRQNRSRRMPRFRRLSFFSDAARQRLKGGRTELLAPRTGGAVTKTHCGTSG